MEKKDTHLENFKQALISTIKSISEKNDCEVSFGKQASKNYNNVNLPEIKKDTTTAATTTNRWYEFILWWPFKGMAFLKLKM